MELTQKQVKQISKICCQALNMGTYPVGTFLKPSKLNTPHLHIVFDPQLVLGNFISEGALELFHKMMEAELGLKFGTFWVGMYRGEHTLTKLRLELHFWAVVKEGS